jgi:glycopeptide antibiotics resistance protein
LLKNRNILLTRLVLLKKDAKGESGIGDSANVTQVVVSQGIQGISISVGMPIQIMIVAFFAIAYFAIKRKINILDFRFWVLSSFVFYLLNVVNVTIFPIEIMFSEEAKQNVTKYFVNTNFVPFKSIIGSLEAGTSIRQNVGNLLLLFPLGMYLQFFFRKKNSSYPMILLYGCIASVSIEILQWILSYFGYNHRSVDIDDVLLNVTGFVMGYILMRLSSQLIKNKHLVSRAPLNSLGTIQFSHECSLIRRISPWDKSQSG